MNIGMVVVSAVDINIILSMTDMMVMQISLKTPSDHHPPLKEEMGCGDVGGGRSCEGVQ